MRAMRRLGRKWKDQEEVSHAWRCAVLDRAQGRCERCQNYVGGALLHCHHRIPRSRAAKADKWNPANGVALCGPCHDGVHKHYLPDWREWIDSHEWRHET